MPPRGARSALLTIGALALAAAAPREAESQDPVVKPTTTLYTRLAAPGPVVARQLPDGRIAVQWRAIAGAAKYQVTRSVPPAPAQVYATTADSTLFDADVKAGSSYYYVVAAVDSAGSLGLKVGSTPVTATISATLTTTGDATAGGASGTAASLTAPTAIVLQPEVTPWLTVFWRFGQSGLQYRVERAVVNEVDKTTSAWVVRMTTGVRPCCSWSFMDDPPALPTGQRYQYRVRAVDPADPTRLSPPLLSATELAPVARRYSPLPTGFWLAPVGVGDNTVRVGAFLGNAPAVGVINPSLVSIDSDGRIFAKAPGTIYILYGSAGPAGDPHPQTMRITITP